MSWPLASFTLVAGVLVAGWLAYERARPSARMVAVVATLAAVAALGRDAFVALPEVKPITAIALVVGYALGPLPGFTVGALGMFASNMLLGQGPYTPWQMAAWGLVGLAGAVLGRLSDRRLGRLQLACACALTALCATEMMNVYEWTVGASHTAAAFLLIAGGTALPFNLVDAGASFFFGLAFAPELARMLARVRTRMDVRWEGAGAATLPLLLALVMVPGAHASAFRVSARPARADLAPELRYLASAQDSDGGFGAAAGEGSSELYTGWAAIGLAAAGRDPATLRRDGHSVLDALRAQAGTLEGPGDIERTILALRACGAPVGSIDGKSLVGALVRYRQADGSFAGEDILTAFAIFALRAAGVSPTGPTLTAAGDWLARQQNADGGFSFAAHGSASDVDDTAAALQGLLDSGTARGSGAVRRAVAYLQGAQNLDGGMPQEPGGESNAQSTAWAVQGLIAAGRSPAAVRRRGSRSPLGYLESLVAPNGSVRYSRTSSQSPVWVTAEALAALAGKPFPVS
ncbi:MAG TPA: prenyltransferase/squalene oxidase repeat-containing protein [Solirubrobacteraceae bacterium]|nr:prenyltransferase/squalene oxidase repeat-containing protein [Solirubrobacteraceae bacterium]